MNAWQEMEARLSAGVSERMLDLARIGPGMRVLDLATGYGEPLVRVAQRVGPSGQVVGVDPCLTDSSLHELSNVSLQAVGAESFTFLPAFFDAATCRWGLFSVPDPVAVRRVRQALKPGGLMVSALWAEYERTCWYSLMREVTSKFLELPPLSSDRPGALRLATLELISRDFGAGGMEILHIEEMECTVLEAPDILGWARAFFGGWIEQLGRRLPLWEEALRAAAEAYRSDGLIRLGGVTRLVVCRGLEG